ncbi:response regulator transcription factor [Pedobacter aquatilis]|uniref:response regulator transcription factor n=1 Tax=Pedobacter aquatilis TaxID=351343 RepID=UPI00292EA321|nr:response regulator [Pedobacter aquatilis]
MKNTIYILEDSADILESLTDLLALSGFQVQGFLSSLAFQQAISLNKPDLFLIDVMLPDGNGVSICENLKLNRDTRSIPVVLLTANSEIQKMKLRSRADDFIAKPYALEDLLKRIKRLLP